MNDPKKGKIIMRVDGKEHILDGTISYNMGKPSVDSSFGAELPSMPVQASIEGTITNTEGLDAFLDNLRKQHEAEVQETLAKLRGELQEEISAFMRSRGKKGKSLTMRQMGKHRIRRKLQALIQRKMLEWVRRDMIAVPRWDL